MRIIRENSNLRAVWDGFILVLIFITFAYIPFQIAFQQDLLIHNRKYLYFLDFFFWIDICLNFVTSYRFKGEEITDYQKTKNHYLKTFFPFDLLANFPFEIFLLFSPKIIVAKIPLVLILISSRLLRIVRLYLIFHRWENHAWINPGYVRIIKLFVTVTILTHLVACIWFLFPLIDDFPKDSWPVALGIENAPIPRQYLYSLYWSVTTMTTIGYGDITPNRDIEYIVTIFVMVLGASVYAFIIGNIVSLISDIDSAKNVYKNKMESVTQFLSYHEVPKDVIFQLKNYYDYLWENHRGLQEDNFFRDLPLHFRLEILQHITQELLEKVPLFRYCSTTLKNVLLTALKPQTYAPNSYIVREGEIGQGIYFISLGKVEVLSENKPNFKCIFEAGEYFGHLSLIFNEKLTASVKTLSYCEIFILSKHDFNYIKNEYPEFKEVLKQIASQNTEKMSQLILEDLII